MINNIYTVLLPTIVIMLMISTVLFCVTDYALIYDLGTSARQIAMGNIDGFSESSDSVFENPAGLYRINQFSMSVFSTKVMGEVQYTMMAISGKMPMGRIGVGVMQATVGDIPKTVRYDGSTTTPTPDNDPETPNYPQKEHGFDYKNSIYKLSYQMSLTDRLEGGINYVYYRNEFYSVLGTGSNFDLGVIYTHPKYETSMLVRNILPNQDVVYNTGAYETLPAQYVLSMRRSFKWGWDIMPQIKYQQEEWLTSLGAKYTPNFLPFIHFMGGYKTLLTVTQSRKTNATVGMGLSLGNISVYYAYERSDYVLNDHKSYVSITSNF
jgi:hypothetical protein